MGVKTILLLIIVVHTCTPDSGSSETSLEDITHLEESVNYTPYEDRPVNNSYKTVIGGSFPMTESTMEKTNRYKIVYQLTATGENAINKIAFLLKSQPNSTDLNAVKFNNTNPSVEVNTISKEAVLFLKSLLVTRVMPSFYIFLFLIGLPLNALALVTFTCKIKAKKPAVIYMSHLACVDLLFTLLLPLKIHYHLNGSHWVFGEGACRVITAAYYCYMYCSILLMMCMSVDRLLAVGLPVASLTWRSTRNSMCVCVLVWLLALAGTVPLLSIKQTFKIENVGITCHDATPKGVASSFYFFLPLVVTLVCYSVIIYVLSAKAGRLATSSSTSDIRRRAVIMTIAVVTEFVACFGPTNGILLYHCVLLASGGTSGEESASYMVYMFVVCVGSSSVFLDPLLYYYSSSQCRQQIRSVFWWRKTKRATKLSTS